MHSHLYDNTCTCCVYVCARLSPSLSLSLCVCALVLCVCVWCDRQVMRVLEEPTAAAIAYGLHQKPNVHHILVYDFGGGKRESVCVLDG